MVNEEKIRIIFGLKVKQLRHRHGLSLQELADRCDLSPSYLNEMEKGRKYPKAEKIFKIAEVLETTYDDLVSLKLERELAPLSEIMFSGILDTVSLQLFGIEQAKIVEMIANAPIQVSALLNAFLDIARNYDIKTENFYNTMLRSYEEIHNNYFPEIESLATLVGNEIGYPLSVDKLKAFLTDKYSYEFIQTTNNYSELKGLRSLYRKKNNPQILFTQELDDDQILFILAKEVGYHYLKVPLNDRLHQIGAHASSTDFDKILNNFRVSYFAGAMLMPEAQMVELLTEHFNNKLWDGDAWNELPLKLGVTPATFMYRLTSILPERLGLQDLFFLRFNYDAANNYLEMARELHLGKKHLPHANFTEEHYCRRWLSFKIMEQMHHENKEQLTQVQRSSYISSNSEYLILTMGRKVFETYTSLTIGIQLTAAAKKAIKFQGDVAISKVKVNVTCQRCNVSDCKERMAPPTILEREQKKERTQAAINQLINS